MGNFLQSYGASLANALDERAQLVVGGLGGAQMNRLAQHWEQHRDRLENHTCCFFINDL